MIHVSANGLVEDTALLPYESWCNDRKSPPNPPIFIQQHLVEAQTLLKQARFRPWVVDGRPTPVAISSGVIIAPPERYGVPHPFPSPVKQSSVFISMQQMGCEGKCPAYRLTIHGDGTLEYEGLAFVFAMGKRTSRISPEVVYDLVHQFKAANFFSALPEYRGAFDGGETLLQISVDGTSHKVNDALGFSAGLPTSIRNLEWSIYRATNVEQWVYGTKWPRNRISPDKGRSRQVEGRRMWRRFSAGTGWELPAYSPFSFFFVRRNEFFAATPSHNTRHEPLS